MSFPSSPPRRARLACAVLLFSSLVAGPTAHADDGVLVTGAREPLARHQLAADVVVIDAARIRDSGADSIEDLLRREAGVQLTRNGGPGQNAGLFIRGAASGQTLLLIDGARIGAATLGQPEWDLLGLADIDRIEVLRGPASSLYGADALGGVVQIVTRRGSGAPRAALRAAAGGYGAREVSASGDLRQGALELAASLAREQARGTSAVRPGDRFGNFNPDADGHVRESGSLRIGLAPAGGQRLGLVVRESRLNAQYDGSEFLPPNFAQDSRPDFRSRATLRQAVLDGQSAIGSQWLLSARVAHDTSERTSGATAPDRFASGRDQAVLQATWQPRAGQQFTVALERARERAESSSYTADARRDNDALVLAWAGQPGRDRGLALQAEWRHDDSSVYGGVDTGRLGLRWPLGGGVALRALVADSFRAPSFNDLVFPGYGVPTLRPERGRSAEAGLEWRTEGPGTAADLALTLYRQDQRDLIAYEPDAARCPPDPAYAFGCARNVQRARLQGATLSGGLRWTDALGRWQLRGTVDALDARDRLTDARLPRRAASQQSLALRWGRAAFGAGAELLRVGGRPDAGLGLPAETTLDLTGEWRFAAGWRLQGRLANATDRDLQPQRDYQGLGRQAWLVLRWEGTL